MIELHRPITEAEWYLQYGPGSWNHYLNELLYNPHPRRRKRLGVRLFCSIECADARGCPRCPKAVWAADLAAAPRSHL